MNTAAYNNKRIINVSNRLPVKILSTDGKITYQNSEGGLSTGLSSVFNDNDHLWIGWPGSEVADDLKHTVIDDLRHQKLHPVFLNKSEINNFYEGFSNETIWPLFHYFSTYTTYNPEHWHSYQAVNRKYADEILKFATNEDIVWIHDYHLMLLPELLRAELPDITIGYFQHIPFPSFEIFRALPWKKDILNGLIGADVIGFQTAADCKHFALAACETLGLKVKDNKLIARERTVTMRDFPISIDYKKYAELAAHWSTKNIAQKLKKQINTKIITSIDRLDYSKGIIQRLRAYELFLKKNPQWRQKVTFVHLIVPSRDNVKNYKELKEEMNRLISDINGKYATLSWQPIRHFYRSFPPNLLSALYKAADVALVTPLIDGMNLVCKEYIASNVCRNGVLVLGEAAGAAHELKDALLVNPNDVEAFASKIDEGLSLPQEERNSRMESLQRTVRESDIFNWAENFMSSLAEVYNKRSFSSCLPVTPGIRQKIDLNYTYAHKRLLLLDYDGTLVPFHKRAEDAVPDAALLKMLKIMAADEHNHVVIISGRDNVTLNRWLGHLPLDIIAEHGAWYKENGKGWYNIPGLKTEWKKIVTNILAVYSRHTPGSYIEEKAYSVAWHYRNSNSEIAVQNVKAIIKDLRMLLRENEVNVLEGNKVLEIKCSAVNKGKATEKLLMRNTYDHILAIGDDTTDEDMFKALPGNAFSIKVGTNVSAAHYYLKSAGDVRSLLQELCEISQMTDSSTVQLAS